VDHVPAGISHDPRRFGGVHEVVRVAAAVDVGQALTLAIQVRPVPVQPLVLMPVHRPADHSCGFGVPGRLPVAVPRVGALDRDAVASRHVRAADHGASVDSGRNGVLLTRLTAS